MHVYDHFPYFGFELRWSVPQGVTEALFECWGAAGGMSSGLSHEGKVGQVVGGPGPQNNSFFNSPHTQGQLGTSFANNAGYAAGKRTVTEGDVYYVYVGGNGGPGHSSIKLKSDGDYEVALRGGAGGYNGGGDGGSGAEAHQNLYESASTTVQYTRDTIPPSAKNNELWLDTSGSGSKLKKCNSTYTSGHADDSKWDLVTNTHPHLVGPSGGGGGGATDIRHGGNALGNRILVAGGGGGSVGPWNKTGKAGWSLNRVPANPAPPFGTDDTSTGATGPDLTWSTSVNYLSGGWGSGGMGGATGPKPNTAPTVDGGYATTADAGGPSTARHKDGNAPDAVNGSGGKGGSAVAGGSRGQGGAGGQDGSKGSGGNGADAAGGDDDWCAGGGGGGGGYFGGGGGGQGFKVTGDNSDVSTRGGGGGGGSNYVDPSFSAFFLGGAAQPPFAKGNSGTGATGTGGFARISYHVAPKVTLTSAPSAVVELTDFDVTFRFDPAPAFTLLPRPGINYYVVGTASDPDATFPTSQQTIMVTDPKQTVFTHTFTAPATGDTAAYFVQATDLDRDASAWAKQKVVGLAATVADIATITSPAANAIFEESATVDWTVGTQTPLTAYRLGVTGTDLVTGAVVVSESGWRRGGSRVNLATDPGFVGTSVWSSDDNADLDTETGHAGVSGHNGKVTWLYADDGSAEQHTTTWDNLHPGTSYRFHLSVASAQGLDPRPVEFQVWDDSGLLTSYTVDLSGTAADTYVPIDMEFTPKMQGVYLKMLPSASAVGGDPYYFGDFEAGTVDGWGNLTGFTASADGAETYQGDFALKVHGHGAGRASSKDITSLLTDGAGNYVATCQAYTPTGADHNAVLRIVGTGVNGGTQVVGEAGSTTNAWVPIRVPFTWDGTSTVTLEVDGWASTDGDIWYDVISVSAADPDGDSTFGSTDSGQVHYLANFLLELLYEEDSGGYGVYFDGSHANGTGLTASWSGSTNASPSYLTGTDILTGDIAYSGDPLKDGSLYLVTLTEAATLSGYAGSQVAEDLSINPSAPSSPVVSLTVDSAGGLMTLSIDADDGSNDVKTVYFDIFRNGVRIATGLTPDLSTRLAAYLDVPASAEAAAYLVRAFDSAGGFADTTTGTVLD